MSNWQIEPLNHASQSEIQQRIDNKTKPVGALGQLETLALQLALIQQSTTLTVPTAYPLAHRDRNHVKTIPWP